MEQRPMIKVNPKNKFVVTFVAFFSFGFVVSNGHTQEESLMVQASNHVVNLTTCSIGLSLFVIPMNEALNDQAMANLTRNLAGAHKTVASFGILGSLVKRDTDDVIASLRYSTGNNVELALERLAVFTADEKGWLEAITYVMGTCEEVGDFQSKVLTSLRSQGLFDDNVKSKTMKDLRKFLAVSRDAWDQKLTEFKE